MRTIDQIIGIQITYDQYVSLEMNGFANGCGGNGKNVDRQLRSMIELLPNFDEDKVEALFQDLRKICILHDLDFFLQNGFRRSNRRMTIRVFQLIHWAPMAHRVGLAISLYGILTRYGYGFYKK